MAPDKVLIPERYLDVDDNTPLSPEEQKEKQKKLERIKALIAKSKWVLIQCSFINQFSVLLTVFFKTFKKQNLKENTEHYNWTQIIYANSKA